MTNGGVYGSLTLSDDVAIESILTGIPLFCVGIFSIGVFTFLLSLKRVDLLSVYLFISSFIGFIAAIVDLGQILIRGHANALNATGFAGVAGFIRAREVLLSLSTGAVFLFFWTFVGRRPVGIPAPSNGALAAASTSNGYSAQHCGSWTRWGYVGLVLKWATFLIVVVIPILQIVWRVTPKHHRYAEVYVTSATLETTISAIFILKILLNFYLTPANLQRQVFLGHIIPVLALLTSAGLGVGNLVLFSFTETTLGRFLRAIEVYVLIVYFLIVTFRVPREGSRHKPQSSIDKPPLPVFEKLTGGPSPAGPYDLRNPSRESTNGALGSGLLRPWRPVRNSALSKVSSWLSFEPFTSRMQGSRDPENALASSQNKLSIDSSPDSSPSLLFRTVPEPGWVDKKDIDTPEDAQSEMLKPPVASFAAGSGGEENRPLTEISLSYYAMETDIRTSFKSTVIQDTSSIGSNSPIYGLDGIRVIPPRRQKPTIDSIAVQPPSTVAASTPANSESLSPIEELLQQQSELDRSISALRGLHTRENSKVANQEEEEEAQSEESGAQVITIPSRRDTVSFASNGIGKPPSTSLSEFSLSNFPEPPEVETPTLTARSTLRPEPARTRVALQPLRIPGIDMASAPGTPSQFGVTAKYDSAATQYDVTSFIGDLTIPHSGYTSGNAIATSSFYKSALSLSDDDLSTPDTPKEPQPTVPPSAKASSPTSTIRPSAPTTASTANATTATTPSNTSPTSARGLGSATMSSSFKAKRPPLQRTEQPAQAAAPPQAENLQQQQPPIQQPNPALKSFLNRSGSARTIQPPSGPRHSKSSSLSRIRTQGGADGQNARF